MPADVFPPLEISPSDVAALKNIADQFVQERVAEFHEHMVHRKGVVDVGFWKRVKDRGQICAYKERRVEPTPVDESGVTALMPMMLMVGTLQGNLDDVIYGTMNHTTKDMHIRTAYVDDKCCDGRILASLVTPTAADPLRSLTLKWDLRDNLTIAPPPLVRMRDLVIMEGVGILSSTAGERIGYHLAHSVQLPGIRELQEYNIVRGNLSICFLYHQVADNVVSVYAKGILNMFGSMPLTIMTTLAAETLVSVWRLVECAELKKLAWIARTTKPTDPSLRIPNTCAVCMKKVKSPCGGGSKGRCCACRDRVCSSCSVKKKLAYSLAHEPKEVTLVKLKFCTRCVLRAKQASAVEVAAYDLYEKNLGIAQSFALDTASSSSGSSSLETGSRV